MAATKTSYAIISVGGKQYRVREGETLVVDRLKADEGKTYSGYLTVLGPRELKLEGCVLGGMICKAETLSRVE